MKRNGVTRDGILWHIGHETIEARRDGQRMRYSGYTLREALAEFRADFPTTQDND